MYVRITLHFPIHLFTKFYEINPSTIFVGNFQRNDYCSGRAVVELKTSAPLELIEIIQNISLPYLVSVNPGKTEAAPDDFI